MRPGLRWPDEAHLIQRGASGQPGGGPSVHQMDAWDILEHANANYIGTLAICDGDVTMDYQGLYKQANR